MGVHFDYSGPRLLCVLCDNGKAIRMSLVLSMTVLFRGRIYVIVIEMVEGDKVIRKHARVEMTRCSVWQWMEFTVNQGQDP